MLAAVAVLEVLGVLAVVFVAGGSEDATDNAARTGGAVSAGKPVRTVRSELTLERAVLPTTGQPEELVVSLPEQRLNVPGTTGGETTVLLRCVDEGGAEKLCFGQGLFSCSTSRRQGRAVRRREPPTLATLRDVLR